MVRSAPIGRRGIRRLVAALTAVTVPLAFLAAATHSASAAPVRYEAENAVCQGTIDSNHTGFSGTGFCNTTNAVGTSVTWTVSAPIP